LEWARKLNTIPIGSRLGDSNPGPMVYETIALPLS
jgi:hypothetical protein